MSASNGNGHRRPKGMRFKDQNVPWEVIAERAAPIMGWDAETFDRLVDSAIFDLEQSGEKITHRGIIRQIGRETGWDPEMLWSAVLTILDEVVVRRAISDEFTQEFIKERTRIKARRAAQESFIVAGDDDGIEAGPRSVSGGLGIRSGSTMKISDPVSWNMEPYIPYGRIGGIDGMEGIGKSLFVVKLMVPILMAGGEVLYVVAEDDPEDILRRLLAAGWDQRSGEVDFFDGDLALPKDIKRLVTQVEGHPYRMVALDPVRDYLADPITGGRNRNAEDHMAPGLLALGKLARRSGVAMPGVHHWNRASEKKGSERYSGAGAYSQKVRHRISLAWDDTAKEGVIGVTKSNIASTGHLRSYWVEEVPEYDTARFVLGDPVPGSFDSWWEAHRNPSAVGFIPEDVLEDWCANNLAPGDQLPADKKLRVIFKNNPKLSAAQIDDARTTLQGTGVLQRVGSCLIYQGVV